MSNLLKFILKAKQKTLEIIFEDISVGTNNVLSLSYEYLRIFAPTEITKAHSAKPPTRVPQVFHKKNIDIVTIEPLGKHGHRLIFSDGYSDIYSNTHFIELSQNLDNNWTDYMASLTSTNNREETINFKAVT